MNNSVNQIIAYLQQNPFTSENQIMSTVFGYNRKTNKHRSNKKYADMLRRGLYSKKIARVKATVAGTTDRFFYYIPKKKVEKTVASSELV